MNCVDLFDLVVKTLFVVACFFLKKSLLLVVMMESMVKEILTICGTFK